MRLYLCDIRQLVGREQQGLDLLPPLRREYALRYRQQADQRRSLAGGLLLRLALGVEHDDQLSYNQAGKPLKSGVEFNLSHSGSFVMLAVDNKPIGVDIELLRPASPAVARRMFSATEQQWLNAAPEGGPCWQRRFYLLWTRKEALIKALGCGLGGLATAELELSPLNTACHVIQGQRWFFVSRCREGHLWSICSAQPIEARLVEVDVEELLA